MQVNENASAASTETNDKVTATVVPDNRRLKMLPLFFGSRHMIRAESYVYNFMRNICESYSGGYWEYYELSNGGFYMAPKTEERFQIVVEGNYFTGEMSADAAGITACLFMLGEMAADTRDEKFIHLLWLLRDYVKTHPEQSLIFRAID